MLKIINTINHAKIAKLVKQNDGYCPCIIFKTKDSICPCKEFREQDIPGECRCGRFEKVEA